MSVVDKNGNLCPADSREVRFKVNGNGTFRANANGDATSLEQFHLPHMKAFSGQITAIVQSSDTPGTVTLRAEARGLKPATITIPVK